jgi:hypothetical protein
MYNQILESNMGLSIIPTNIGGVSLNGILGPLSSLFRSTSVKNMVYPSDLASNPAMGHAVQFSIYEYTSGFADNGIASTAMNLGGAVVGGAVNGIIQTGSALVNGNLGSTIGSTTQGFIKSAETIATNGLNTLEKTSLSDVAAQVGNISPSVAQLFQAKSYQPVHKTESLANISLFMPETLTAQFNSTYTEVEMTQNMGIRGKLGNAFGDLLGQNPGNGTQLGANPMASVYGKALTSSLLGRIITGAGSDIAQQAAGIITNPQVQLLYRSVALREFTLDFLLTPKDSAEAKTCKDICDTFTYYSLPGIAGAQEGISGQYLTPPQIFSIKFKFLGKKGVLGTISNIFTSAMNNIGLGFLTNVDPTGTITSGEEAKIMTINDCVLENVSIDYAPNGWSAYNDGYPIQTRLTLTFKETQMITKQQFKGSAIDVNYSRTPSQVAQNGYQDAWNDDPLDR